MTDTKWRHPSEYQGEPVCGLGVACRSVWPNCVTASKVFDLMQPYACEIACQKYNWFECDQCGEELRKEQEE